MRHWDEDQQPEGVDDVIRRLRDHKPEATALELDRMKMRAKAVAASSRTKGSTMRSRLLVALATLGLMVGGTGGVIAAKGGNSQGNASKSEYRPGNGCGDKNHTHTGAPGQNKKGNTGPKCPGNGNNGNNGNNGSPGNSGNAPGHNK